MSIHRIPLALVAAKVASFSARSKCKADDPVSSKLTSARVASDAILVDGESGRAGENKSQCIERESIDHRSKHFWRLRKVTKYENEIQRVG